MLLDDILKNLKEYENKKVYSNGKIEYNYGTLYKYVRNLYNYLNKIENGKTPIIVYGHKDIYMLVCFLACSFAGITYVPIDISTPKERVREIINQINPKNIFAIADINLDAKQIIDRKTVDEICLNDETNYNEIKPLMSKDDIYYIIFTSGSTGIPKGVQISYKKLNCFVEWFKYLIPTNEGVILNQAAFSFDLSVADIYLALATKSELVVLENKTQQNYPIMFDILRKSNINTAIITPSFAEVLLLDKSFNSELLPKLNTIYFCGEILPVKTAEKLLNRFKELRIINSYGPTECTVAVTAVNIDRELLYEENLPIADYKELKQNAQIYIVDSKLNILSDGQVGEMLICGESISDGYFDRNSKDNEKFIKFNGKYAYLTGDLGYYKNNKLYFKSRKDRQVKYKGYRIELSDIEENLNRLEDIEKSAVIPKIFDNKVIKLIGYVKLKENSKKSIAEIRKELLEKMPEYMCPNIKILKEFTINNNGKTDFEELRRITNGR